MADVGFVQVQIGPGTYGDYNTATIRTILQGIKDAGATHVRVAAWWTALQSTAGGTISWTGLDQAVVLCAEYGLTPLLVITSPPPAGGTPTTANYAALCGSIAARYGAESTAVGSSGVAAGVALANKCHDYEIWNEANHAGFATPFALGAATYTPLLIAAANAIRAADSQAFILCTGLMPLSTDPADVHANHVAASTFMEGVYANGGKGYFDAAAFHWYTHEAGFGPYEEPTESQVYYQEMLDIRQVMVDNDDAHKELWVTEMGIPSLTVTEADRAAWIVTQLEMLDALDWVAKVFIYNWRNTDSDDSQAVNTFGAVEFDFDPKTEYLDAITEYISPTPTPHEGGVDLPIELPGIFTAAETEVIGERLANLRAAIPTINEHRRRKRALKRAMPVVSLWVNPPNGETDDGLLYLGRVSLADCDSYEFPFKNNESSSGTISVRAEHYIAKKIASIPNDPDMCKNVVITVDMYGGELRWSGLMHHWGVASPGGTDYITASFNDDLQFLDFMLAPPNPALPIPIFQFPRVWPMFGPSRWCVATLILMQIIRLEGHPWTLPDDPFDPEQWLDIINWASWQVHIKGVNFLTDDSLWTLLASRMNTVASVIADALDDAQLTITYRRIMRNQGETVTGLLFNDVKHGALVFEIVDRSGWTLPEGTFFEGTAVAGFFRSVLTWGSGFIEDSLTMVSTTDQLYPDEYYQTSWMSTLAAAPGVVVRDSHYTDLQSEVTHSPPTAVSVVVGGNNPAADAVARLIIESVGNLLGYFLLAGFDSLGDMAADIIMPFLTGTILAWDEWKNFARADSLGWVHLHEIYQQGGEQNAWSLAALAALRGGFKATGTQTSHTMVIGDDMWTIPGLHFNIGDRIGSTAGALQRLGIDMIFVNQVEEMTLSGKGIDRKFLVRCGKNKAALSMGERMARLMKKALDTIQNIGVHLIQ